jgi:hypothetical protein
MNLKHLNKVIRQILDIRKLHNLKTYINATVEVCAQLPQIKRYFLFFGEVKELRWIPWDQELL